MSSPVMSVQAGSPPASPREGKETAPTPPQPPAVWQYLSAAGLCGLYLAAGPSLMVLNKHIMRNLHFNFPVFLSSLGQTVTGIYAVVTVHYLRPMSPQAREAASELATWNCWLRRVLPIGVAKATTLASGNAAYLYLNLSFIQMLKAFSPVTVLAVGAALGVEHPRPTVCLTVLFIALSTLMTISTEPNGSTAGVFCMVVAQTSEAVSIVLTQWLLKSVKLGVTEAQSILAPSAVLALAFATAVLELPRLLSEGRWHTVLEYPLLFFAASVLGLTINMLTFAVISATSALTLKILATVRNVAGVLVGVTFLGEHVPHTEWAAYGGSLCGFAAYSYVRAQPEASDRMFARCIRRCPVPLPESVLAGLSPPALARPQGPLVQSQAQEQSPAAHGRQLDGSANGSWKLNEGTKCSDAEDGGPGRQSPPASYGRDARDGLGSVSDRQHSGAPRSRSGGR